MAYLPDEELIQLAKTIREVGTPIPITPKKLLEHFGVVRRKTHVKWWVDKALSELKIKTEPSYKSEWFYGQILLKKDEEISEPEDFIQRLKLLEAANRPPISVTKNDSLQKAMTLMMANDYSQLPVMNSSNAKTVDGIISWHSIGWATAKGKKIEKVGDCLNSEVVTLSYETPILEAIETIRTKEVVLVQKNDKTISGLLTVADIADEFFTLAEPFLLLGQIETSLRVLLGNRFTAAELKDIKFGADSRDPNSVSDLNFNEYIQLMRKGDNWRKLDLPLDKDEFTKKLEEVRDIRNDVMHFSSDNLEPEHENVLRQTAQFLKEILSK